MSDETTPNEAKTPAQAEDRSWRYYIPLMVIVALKQNLKIDCPCMGTVLKVPLSTVTLTENLGMAALALVMLLQHSR